MVSRQDALLMLAHDVMDPAEAKELTAKELVMLAEVASTSPQGCLFWGTAELVHSLARWGGSTAAWLKGCACHEHGDPDQRRCKLRGRRAIQLASGHACASVRKLSGPDSPASKRTSMGGVCLFVSRRTCVGLTALPE